MGSLILVIDDSITICRVIEITLRQEGYEVKSCASAEQAIAWLGSEARIPDLILVDLLLPKMDGYGLIRHLRVLPGFRLTPIVVISRHDGLMNKLKAKLLEASAYVVKPLLVEDLISVTQMYLG